MSDAGFITESALVSDPKGTPPMFFYTYSYRYTWTYRVYRPAVVYTWSCY